MINTHFKSKQNQFWHLDTEIILSPPLYILLDRDNVWSYKYPFFYEKLVSKGILLHKLHTFLFNDIGNGIFSNTDTQH